MNNDRLKFRTPHFDRTTRKFCGFNYFTAGDTCRGNLIDAQMFGKDEQCTGLRDKNGNLIYEHDRVKARDQIGTVRFGFYRKTDEHFPDAIYGFYIDWDTKPCFRQDFGYWMTEGLEIIGNVHQEDLI